LLLLHKYLLSNNKTSILYICQATNRTTQQKGNGKSSYHICLMFAHHP